MLIDKHEYSECFHFAIDRLNAGEKPWFSRGICGTLTAGWGDLDQNGYWEFPLPIEVIESYLNNLPLYENYLFGNFEGAYKILSKHHDMIGKSHHVSSTGIEWAYENFRDNDKIWSVVLKDGQIDSLSFEYI